jgi:hypothetical protein
MTVHTRAAIVAIIACAPGVRAQAAPSPVLQQLTALDAKRVASVERGDAVTIHLDAPDNDEIALLGVVRLDVPRAFYVEHVRELSGSLVGRMQSSSGNFHDPARLEDVASLALQPSDAKSLQKCKPLSCDVKLPAETMEKLRTALGKLHDPKPTADSMMREWIVDYVNAYRADSGAQMVVYDDTKRSVRSSDAFRALLAEPMPAGIDSQPFAQMLAVPRTSRPPEVVSHILWELDRLNGLKPTLELMERSMYSSAAYPGVTWMTTKQLYASHYFEAQIDFITVADGDASAGTPDAYLVILRRMKFDDLPTGGLFNIRRKAVNKLRDGLRSTLTNTRAALSKAYADQATGPERTH